MPSAPAQPVTVGRPASRGPGPAADPVVPTPVPVSTNGGRPEQSRRVGGVTSIAEPVVAKLAARATREFDEVESMGGTISGALSGVVGRIRGDDHRTAGVGVEVGRTQAAIDLSLSLRYPVALTRVTTAIRSAVAERITTLTGLEVTEVNIAITDLIYGARPKGDEPERVA